MQDYICEVRKAMLGTLYAVGVGPGDPELLTLKAIKTMKDAECIACPTSHGSPGLAYQIAAKACPEIVAKELLLLDFPMRKEDLSEAHQEAAEHLIRPLSSGKNVAFLTLGDPEFYSTFYYVAEQIKERGYEIEIVAGITSFSAASARRKLPLAIGDESVKITFGEYCDFDGTLVILKAGSKLKEIKEHVIADQRQAYMVENCGMLDERVYPDVHSIPDEAGYFSVVVVK